VQTYATSRGESAVDVEETYGVLDRPVLKKGVDAGGLGHIHGEKRMGL
jgi:hypothetical protein